MFGTVVVEGLTCSWKCNKADIEIMVKTIIFYCSENFQDILK